MSVPSPTAHVRSIILLTHEFYPVRGGIATFVEEIARAAGQLGCDVEVWAPEAASVVDRPDWPFRVRRLSLRGSQDWGCRWRLAREIFRHRRLVRQSTLCLAEPGPMLAMMLLQFFRGVRPSRLVLTFHGSEILRFSRWPWRRWLARRLIRRADLISTLSRYTRGLLVRNFGEPGGRLVLTPGAPRPGIVAARPRVVAAKSKLVVLTVGRLHPRKGQLCVIQALQLLAPELRQRVEYWIAGIGRAAYVARLRAASGGMAIRFLGEVSDEELADAYAQADIFALTSLTLARSVEGFGLVYLEAGEYGLPVVAHAVGGVAEVVEDEVTGLLVPPGEPTLLAAALERLIVTPALRERLGAAGRQRARGRSWRESAVALFAAERGMA